MIIQNDLDIDRNSVRTLVSSPLGAAMPSSVVSKPIAISALTTPTLNSFAISIPLFVFALNHITFSHAQSTAAIIAFSMSVPLYIAATVIGCSQTTPRRMPSKTIILVYVVLLQALWAVSIIQSALITVQTWNDSPQFPSLCTAPDLGPNIHINAVPNTSSEGGFKFICYRDTTPHVTLLMSCILALLEVIMLGGIARVIIRLDITQTDTGTVINNSTRRDAASSSHDHVSINPSTAALRFLLPLAYTSLGLSIPPLVTAIHHISSPSLYLFVVPTIAVSVLTSLFLIVNLYLGTLQATPTTVKHRSTTTYLFFLLLLLLTALWLLSSTTTLYTFKTPTLWRSICPDDIALPLVKAACRVNLQGPVRLNIVWCSMQVTFVGAMTALWYVRSRSSNGCVGPDTDVSMAESSTQRTMKGPRMAF
ncbi:hypothetical protein BJ165DRAFT_1467633 [Panaeolus papilionaceus]|nr:hypothetical protein BJ165DRAFT_1467633 [Panaeolus papilionaceus]